MDGIIGASIKTIRDLFNKLVAINATGISRRNLLSMVLGAPPMPGDHLDDEGEDQQEEAAAIEDVGEILEDNEEQDSVLKSFTGFLNSMKTHVSKRLPSGDDDWLIVEEAVKGRPQDDSGNWEVLGTNLLQMFVEEDRVEAK